MKIHQNPGINQERFVSTRTREIESASFQNILAEKQTALSKERLDAIFQNLEQQGNRVAHSRSLHDIMLYKQIIRDFVKEVVQNGVSIEDHKSYHPNGREKQLKLVKQVDQKLLELSEQVFDKQAPSVDVLTKMGEIKGLLINLYL